MTKKFCPTPIITPNFLLTLLPKCKLLQIVVGDRCIPKPSLPDQLFDSMLKQTSLNGLQSCESTNLSKCFCEFHVIRWKLSKPFLSFLCKLALIIIQNHCRLNIYNYGTRTMLVDFGGYEKKWMLGDLGMCHQ